MNRVYLCIDLKTFFASVECVERGLDPFKVDLVVADPNRCSGAICLAISPKMKSRGIRNRCRLFEIPSDVKYIIAKPRMKKYIEYSSKIYGIYLKYVSSEDIHVYSIDEAFLDVTSYLKMYKMDAFQLAKTIMKDIYDETGITSACGIGPNLYLTKIALDITAKHVKDNIGYLDIEKYKKELWNHQPLTDFWQVGRGIEKRLNNLGIYDMEGICKCEEDILFKEFGINARLLIDHAWGIEPCLISDIKKYRPKSTSISNGQILAHGVNYLTARKILVEMIDNLVLQLVEKKKCASGISLYINYEKDECELLKGSKRLSNPTNSFTYLKDIFLDIFDYEVDRKALIKKINIGLNNLVDKRIIQVDMFSDEENSIYDEKIEEVMNFIKGKYGKNSILRAVSYDEGATGRERNKLIGGHNAE